MCASGKYERILGRSITSVLKGILPADAMVLDAKFIWVNITPFGTPVVPDV